VIKKKYLISIVVLLAILPLAAAHASICSDCHKNVNPGIVGDWQMSKHSAAGVDCANCHGENHKTAKDFDQAGIPTPEVCGACHEEQVAQFKSSKHAFAWTAMNAMPTIHWQPMAMVEGMKGCGGCHKIGLKTQDEIRKLQDQGRGFGMASCDACHTRHVFSLEEARQPQACQTCHMGFDHPQWEMYSSSKHGIRYSLKQLGKLSDSAAGPTCQSCHFQFGDHGVKTAWGFLAVRLPMPDDNQWAADRTTILQALGVLDPQGNPTPRLDAVKAADISRLTQADWQKERDRMVRTCAQCHSANFVGPELQKGDDIIRSADSLMADAIRIVAGLYQDSILAKPASYSYPFPDLLTFHDAATPIEQKLFVMFLEHRMRAFQGAFHSNPDYSLWYGWSEMVCDLTEIRTAADEMRQAIKR
jgi:hypothetical protein